MKKTNEIVFTLSSLLISYMIGIFTLLCTTKLDSVIRQLEVSEGVVLPKLYIAIYIISAIFLLLTILSVLFSVSPNRKVNTIAQNTILFLSLIALISLVVFYLVVKFRTYDYLYETTFGIETIESEFKIFDSLYTDLFLMSLLHGGSSVALSIICFKYSLRSIEENGDLDNTEESGNSAKEDLQNEIKKMKEELEIKDLKKQYEKLYNELKKD